MSQCSRNRGRPTAVSGAERPPPLRSLFFPGGVFACKQSAQTDVLGRLASALHELIPAFFASSVKHPPICQCRRKRIPSRCPSGPPVDGLVTPSSLPAAVRPLGRRGHQKIDSGYGTAPFELTTDQGGGVLSSLPCNIATVHVRTRAPGDNVGPGC